MTMEKTLLVISLPGTGKTAAAKVLNFAEKEFDRPAIDFDYRGTRFNYDTASDVRIAQSKLFNIFADHHVNVILTHWNAFRVDSLNIEKFKLLFIVPTYDKAEQAVSDIIARDGSDSLFANLCQQHYHEWVDQINQMYDKAKKRFKENCFRISIDKDYYVIDALYQCCEIDKKDDDSRFNLFNDSLRNIAFIIEHPTVDYLASRSVLYHIKYRLLHHINMFMDYQADNNIIVTKNRYMNHWVPSALHAFTFKLKFDILCSLNAKITWQDLLSRMRYEAMVKDIFFPEDEIDEYLSVFGN